MPGQLLYWVSGQRALLEYITDDAIAQLYVTKFSTISHYFTKLFVKQSFAIASSVTYGEIRQNFSYSHTRQTKQNGVPHVFFSCLGWSEQTCPLFTICLGGLGPVCLEIQLLANLPHHHHHQHSSKTYLFLFFSCGLSMHFVQDKNVCYNRNIFLISDTISFCKIVREKNHIQRKLYRCEAHSNVSINFTNYLAQKNKL